MRDTCVARMNNRRSPSLRVAVATSTKRDATEATTTVERTTLMDVRMMFRK